MIVFHCSGWWEQEEFGRQSMHELQLAFEDGRVAGTGTDIVGDFEVRGEIRGNTIYLRKQYIGQHLIEYDGVSMGEGAYGGHWSFEGNSGGKWFIRVLRQA